MGCTIVSNKNKPNRNRSMFNIFDDVSIDLKLSKHYVIMGDGQPINTHTACTVYK